MIDSTLKPPLLLLSHVPGEENRYVMGRHKEELEEGSSLGAI